MYEGLLQLYIKLLINKRILLENPTGLMVITLLKIFSLVLILFFVIKIIFHIFSYAWLRRQFPRWEISQSPEIFTLLRTVCEETKISKIPELFKFSDTKPLIFTIGLLKPSIFVSPRLISSLSGKEIRTVFSHELQHIKRKDALYLWIFKFATALIPLTLIVLFGVSIVFNPQHANLLFIITLLIFLFFSFVVRRRFLYLRELSCDDQTILIIKDPLLLASTLIKVWRIGSGLPGYGYRFALSVVQPFMTTRQSLEIRVKRLIEYKRPVLKFFIEKLSVYIIAGAILFTSFILFHFNSKYTEQATPQKQGKFQFQIVKRQHDNPEKLKRIEKHINKEKD